jgi:hypothetical protein
MHVACTQASTLYFFSVLIEKTRLRKPQNRRDREETQKEGESVTPHLDPIGFLGFGLRAERGLIDSMSTPAVRSAPRQCGAASGGECPRAARSPRPDQGLRAQDGLRADRRRRGVGADRLSQTALGEFLPAGPKSERQLHRRFRGTHRHSSHVGGLSKPMIRGANRGPVGAKFFDFSEPFLDSHSKHGRVSPCGEF